MTTSTAPNAREGTAAGTNNGPLVAMPERSLSMTQDAEWCVVRVDGQWRQIRFHDYDDLYAIPGLYEKVIYDILRCDSPHVICSMLAEELSASGTPVDTLRVLDLGAGNGIVAQELVDVGVQLVAGVDIIEEAAEAARRDRPGVYEGYHVVDMTALPEAQRRGLASYHFNAMVCVAALGFGDIPTRAFAAAYNLILPGGWIGFNIKEDFLSDGDHSGFSRLVRSMLKDGTFELRQRRRYQHRLATNRRPLYYVAIIGRKHRDIDAIIRGQADESEDEYGPGEEGLEE